MRFDKILEVREENNLLQKDIAKVLDISTGAYAMNEEGYDTITLKNLVSFCDYFSVSIDFIFGLTNVKRYNTTLTGFNSSVLCLRLKKIRKEKKYTQVMVGEMLNIDHSVWCRYEQGKTTISTIFLYEFCKNFSVSADYLLGRIDSPKYIK